MSQPEPDLRPRTIFQAIEGMALAFNPERAKDLRAVIQFHVTGDGGGEWHLDIAEGQCHCERGVAPDPSLTITTPAPVWLAIARGEMKGSIGLMTGKYKASGRMDLLLKLDGIFSRQLTVDDIAGHNWSAEQ